MKKKNSGATIPIGGTSLTVGQIAKKYKCSSSFVRKYLVDSVMTGDRFGAMMERRKLKNNKENR